MDRISASFDMSSFLVLAIEVLVSLWLLYLAVRRYLKAKVIDKIPGPAAWPLIGNASMKMETPQDAFRKGNGELLHYSRDTGITRQWLGPYPFVFLCSSEAVEPLVTSTTELKKAFMYEYMEPWLGTGLITSTGKKWQSRRKLLTPAFHFSILDDFIHVMNKQCQTLIQKLREKADGRPFDIYPFIKMYALDVICQSAMGCCINAQTAGESDYVKAVERLSGVVELRTNYPWLGVGVIYKLSGYHQREQDDLEIVKGFTKKVVAERRRTTQTKTVQNGHDKVYSNRLAFLDLILSSKTSDGRPLSDDDIQEEVDTFMFAGHDTTTAGSNWCLFMLGLYPDVQEKCYREQQEIFGDSQDPPTSNDLRKMKYLDACLKETQRLYPSVPMIGRMLKEDMHISGYKIPANTAVMISNYVLHQDPKCWQDPAAFDPDRFYLNDNSKMHPFAYTPFSAGPRNCIGQKFALMEEKVTLSTIIRNFKVTSVDRRDTIDFYGHIVLKPTNGINVKLIPRDG